MVFAPACAIDVVLDANGRLWSGPADWPVPKEDMKDYRTQCFNALPGEWGHDQLLAEQESIRCTDLSLATWGHSEPGTIQ